MKVIFDQYAALSYEDRDQALVNADCQKAWKHSPVHALRLLLVISKKNPGEGISRWLWLANNQPDTFSHNLHKLVDILGYEGLIALMARDVHVNGWENRTKLIWYLAKIAVVAGLQNENMVDHILMALPKIQSSEKEPKSIKSGIGKFFAITFFGKSENEQDYSSYRKYRKLCNGSTYYIKTFKYQLDLTKCNRRMVALLGGLKFAASNSINLPAMKQNYDGSVFQIFRPFGFNALPQVISTEQMLRIDSQWESFIANCKKISKPNSALVVVDQSTSTEGRVGAMSSFYIGKCLAYMYATLNVGYFHNKYAVFNEQGCAIRKLANVPASLMWKDNCDIVFSQHNTLDKILNFLKNLGDLEPSEYPSDIIIVSDGGFELPGVSYEKFMKDLYAISPAYAQRVKVLILNIPNTYNAVTPFNKEDVPANITYVNTWEPANMWALTSGGGIYKPFNDNIKARFYAEMENPDIMDAQVVFRKKKRTINLNKE